MVSIFLTPFPRVFAAFVFRSAAGSFQLFMARRSMGSSDQMHAVDALAIEGDEGRGNLR